VQQTSTHRVYLTLRGVQKRLTTAEQAMRIVPRPTRREEVLLPLVISCLRERYEIMVSRRN